LYLFSLKLQLVFEEQQQLSYLKVLPFIQQKLLLASAIEQARNSNQD